MSKSVFASKTFWFNLLTILVAVAAYFGFTPNEALTVQISNGLLVIAPLVNIGLRYLTNKSVHIL